MGQEIWALVMENLSEIYRLLIITLSVILAYDVIANVDLGKLLVRPTPVRKTLLVMVLAFLIADPLSAILSRFVSLLAARPGTPLNYYVTNVLEGLALVVVVLIVYRGVKRREA